MTSNPFPHTRVAGADRLEVLLETAAARIFEDTIVKALSALSSELMKPEFRPYPDVVSLGFFCRSASLSRMARAHADTGGNRIGRGVSAHYTPSNIPLNFCYSMIAGLLAGNVCAVRLSERTSVEADRVIEKLEAVLVRPEFKEVRNRIYLFRCAPSDENNAYLASISDVRVLWGGDETIDTIRRAPLKPHAFDITFPDRYSISLISSGAYLEESDKKSVAAFFFNDTFVFDQNACSSPRSVYWVGPGEITERAQARFWDELHQFMAGKGYRCPASMTSQKLMRVAGLAVGNHAPRVSRCRRTGNVVVTVDPAHMPDSSGFCAGGYFLQTGVERLDDLPAMRDRKLQTVTYFGFEKDELAPLLLSFPPKISADRLVKTGNATAFEIVWDGYDLITQMSKRLVIQ